MEPKKKKAPSKKKSSSSSEDKTQPAKKKSAAPKKSSRQKKSNQETEAKQINLEVKQEKTTPPKEEKPYKIYEDPNLLKTPSFPEKDIIKILTRNPLEVFIFWNISPSTFEKSIHYFQADPNQIGLELQLEYNDDSGKPISTKIPIHPLSKNYFCRFPSPVKNLRATLYAICFGNYYILFNSHYVDLPSNKPSDIWDEAWIHPHWIEKGYFKKDASGKYILSVDIEDLPLLGSSGFMGASWPTSGSIPSSRG